jgi:hypothetical protein
MIPYPARYHLAREEQEAGDVAPIAPSVPEAGEPGIELPRVEAGYRIGRSRPERAKNYGDALLDLAHGAEGQG